MILQREESKGVEFTVRLCKGSRATWEDITMKISFKSYSRLRLFLGIAVMLYAFIDVIHFASAGKCKLANTFTLCELVFWALGPSFWFFAEYYAADGWAQTSTYED
jgi:hypothetical protein